MLNDINNCTSGLHSDHSILKLDLNTDKHNRDRGFWKFNNDLLHDKDYVHLIKKIISDCKRNLHQYTDKRTSLGTYKAKNQISINPILY